jgi:hypothetical protein
MKKYLLLFFMTLLMTLQVAHGQVLISLLFGDKLNSPTLKFGLDGGANFSTISNISPSKYRTGFNLGFYFDFLLKKDKPWYLHTGVLVKSALGAKGISPYHLTNSDSTALDSLFFNGTVDRKLSYFNVPVLIRYRFKNQLFVELGPMISLMYKAKDEFSTQVENEEDLTFTNDVKDLYRRIDVGGMAGIGYYIHRRYSELKGNEINLGFRYYYGFMDILKDNPGNAMHNSSFYLFASIPIGAGEKGQAKKAAATKERQEKKEKKLKEQELKKKQENK